MSVKSYFTFTRRERNGIIVLSAFIFAVTFAAFMSDYFVKDTHQNYTQFDEQVKTFMASAQASDSINFYVPEETHEPGTDQRRQELFVFDPNKLPIEEWMRLGLSRKQAESIKNYENKGGQFRSKEDVRKMYAVSPEFFESIEDYIKIEKATIAPKISEDRKPFSPEINKVPEFLVDLNTADTTELKMVKGIGSFFANNIVKHRTKLGGFTNKAQLLEVFGMDSIKYDEIKDQVEIRIKVLRKIDINGAKLYELRNHPYIDDDLAKLIVNYRNIHGNFESVDELKKLSVMTPELYKKISPYLMAFN